MLTVVMEFLFAGCRVWIGEGFAAGRTAVTVAVSGREADRASRNEGVMMGDVHELAVPKLHLTLRETRIELEQMRDLASRLAQMLDAHVDADYAGGPPVDRRRVGQVLYEAREAGLIEAA
jgi:hypothetical protein